MLAFSTEFPLPEGITSADMCGVVQKWLMGSRYTRFTAQSFEGFGSEEAWTALAETESLESLREVTSDIESLAIVYRKQDADFEWITTIVYAAQPTENWVSIRVECEPLHLTAKIPPAKKPVLIKTLLNDFDGGVDGAFKVSDKPVLLTPSEVDLAVDCILGRAACYLPVVYISVSFNDRLLVNPYELAKSLHGMAHVIVEPNRVFSHELMTAAQRKNVYGGTIGLYWSEGSGRRCFFARSEEEQTADIQRAIFEEIRKSLLHRRPLVRCTLAAVKELRSRRQINALKDAGSKAVDEYVRVFEDERVSKRNELEAAEAEISRLKAEIRRFESSDAGAGGLQLNLGKIQNFYKNEIAEIVHDALKNMTPHVTSDSRRQHVLEALVEANNGPFYSAEKRDKIKTTLRGYASMDSKTKRILEELGFSITEDGKHYKLVYQGDDRYTLTLPKSGSDHRGGLNAALDICRLLF